MYMQIDHYSHTVLYSCCVLLHLSVQRCDDVQPRVIDQEMEFKQQQDRLKKLTEYREWRKEVTVRREIEATLRDENKSTQIQLAEDWQVYSNHTCTVYRRAIAIRVYMYSKCIIN